MFFTELNKKLRIRHRVLSRICIRSFYFILFFVFLVYYSCTFLLSRTMIFYSSVTKSSSSASSVSITSSVNAVSSFSKLSFTASALTASAFSALRALAALPRERVARLLTRDCPDLFDDAVEALDRALGAIPTEDEEV